MLPEPVIVNEAPLTVKPEAEPPTDNASASPTTLSERVVRVNVPYPDDPPAAIVTSNVS